MGAGLESCGGWSRVALVVAAASTAMGCRWAFELTEESFEEGGELVEETHEPTNGIGGTSMSGTGGIGGAPLGWGGEPVAPSECGDGIVAGDEECDDAGQSSSCNADCTPSTCGDNVLNELAGEECEPALAANCKSDCSFSYAHYMIHRFSFEGTGTDAVDSIGDGHGIIINTQLDGSGQLELAGGTSHQFATLRNGLASEQTNATFEAWVTWNGGDQWQRVFDFGNSSNGERRQGTGNSYLFLTPTSFNGKVRAAFSTQEIPQETFVEGSAALPIGVETHVAVVVDDDNDLLQLYVDGVLEGEAPWTESLALLDDVNNWLGISQYDWDPDFGGSIDEFRIYRVALSAEHVEESFAGGPEL